MTLDITEPSDTRKVSEHAAYIRANRTEINALEAGISDVLQTDYVVGIGQTTLVITTNLSSAMIEIINVTALGAEQLDAITGGSAGQIKIFIFGDSNIDMMDSASQANGTFFLNHLPSGTVLPAGIRNVLALVNVGGDGLVVNGYWKELYRTISVK